MSCLLIFLYRYYEELKCDEVNTVLYERLKGGEKPTLSYGKLMERVLYFTNLRREGNRSQVMLDGTLSICKFVKNASVIQVKEIFLSWIRRLMNKKVLSIGEWNVSSNFTASRILGKGILFKVSNLEEQ